MSIKESAAYLKLPFIKNNYKEALMEAHMSDMTHEEFLEGLLNSEVEARCQNAVRNRIRNARFPYTMILNDYKRDHFSAEIRIKIRELETLEFIDNGENIVLIGNPGTGKTALSVALGMKACQNSKTVLFINASNLLIDLREAMNLNQINRYKKKFEKYDLVIVDELGYCTFDKERGEILFNLLSSRNEKGSTIITSNLTLNRWNEIFNDQVLTGAMIDRLAYKSHLIDMTGDSYRVIETKKWNESKGKNQNGKQ